MTVGFKDECTAAVRDIVTTEFNTRVARVVPKTEDITQKDGAVYIEAAYLYADMADSTGMARDFEATDAAKIIRAYLHAVCRVLRDRGGAIRSFDGDRVMAIFTGDCAADDAVDAALRITWVVAEIVHAQLSFHNDAYWQQWNDNDWRVRHRTGIAIGQALIVRAGVRDNSDLVSIGDAPNIAAKLSDYKGGGTTIITDEVWDKLKYRNCYAVNSQSDNTEELPMWSAPISKDIGGLYETIRTSTWWRQYS
ncbi:adenylate/guanylate cyclase domain-containing protein [Mycobacteroides abscessus]|uniref:adenylate/guanylate cyclase domain-containing protein n=1 Tax=Mycobacteroides abscessus TaxID=36809 RepID=UPI0009A79DBC|nr:adenylate/guanylate cyclase domain-containing protein [Mycobacteroides abscessus]